jgi:hypothetical protein
MAKRKFTRHGEKPIGYRCTKQKCKWEGKEEEKTISDMPNGWKELTCPKCGNNEFYGLLN